MSRRFHLISFAAAFVWIALGVLFPSWEGRSYHPPGRGDQPHVWYEGGTFGLRRGWSGDLNLAPLWAPPQPHANLVHPPIVDSTRPNDGPIGAPVQTATAAPASRIDAAVRWPWQAPNQPHHIEISVPNLVLWVSAGMILLGFAGRIASAIRQPVRPDPVVLVTWMLALGLIAGIVLGFILAVFTMGLAPVFYYLILVLVGGAVGLVAGAIRASRARELSKDGVSSQHETGGSWGFEKGVLWFALGFLGSLALTYLSIEIAWSFRGPVLRISTLFTPEYERPQWPIDLAQGASICLTGWVVGVWLYRGRGLRALGAGLATGATIFGVLSAL